MPGDLIGTAGLITARRAECEEAINQLAQSDVVDAKVITKLRGQLGREMANLVVSVAALQKKARSKFGEGTWWVTEKSLQQATARQVAGLKSNWFGDRLVYDLCCGIGGDAIELAKRGRLVAVDSDATLAEMAAANLARTAVMSEPAQARCDDATTVEISPHAAIHIDPDRRVNRDRKSRPEHYQPSWSQVLEIIAKTDCAVVKLAPAARLESATIGRAHRCWISLRGSVREQSLLRGQAIQHAGLTPNTKSAVSLSADAAASWFAPSAKDLASVSADVAAKPLSLLIDPDASIRAAGLTEAFACQHRFKLLGSPAGFLTCDAEELITPATAAIAVVGHVIWSGTCDDRKLRRELRYRNMYPAAVKVRGTEHNPGVLAKRYRKCGEQPVTLWIGRAGDQAVAAITS